MSDEGRSWAGGVSAAVACVALLLAVMSLPGGRAAAAGRPASVVATGYWFASASGATSAFAAPSYGTLAGAALAEPIVGMTSTPDGNGYWMVARDGGVFSFGDAQFYGSAAGRHLSAPIVGMAADASSGGYWLVGADGSVYGFGAPSLGSMAGHALAQPVVAMAATPDGGGYWLVARDGGVFSFGDARFHGSTGGVHLVQPIVGIAGDPVTGGYWLVAADGGVFSFDAPFLGSMGGVSLDQPIVGTGVSPDGGGYWLVARDGGVFSFGDARFHGSTGGTPSGSPVVAIAPVPVDHTLLVVGDSLMAQTASKLIADRPVGTAVWVAGGSGSAPCDWVVGYDNPFSQNSFDSFAQEMRLHHPQEVVFAFSGNPGYSGPAAGCVEAYQPYSLDQLLASYQQSLIALATAADDAGARVYLDASPARNPDAPAINNYNGLPAINEQLLQLTTSPEGLAHHWQYDPTAAELLGGQPLLPTTTTMDWQLYLPCSVSPADPCVDGLTTVRAGDGIHLDTGAGTTLEAAGVEHEPLDTTLPAGI